MNSKTNQHCILWVAKAGLLLSSLFVANVMAAECGQATLVEAGSAGTNVAKSTCEEKSRLASGSVVELAAGGRMWLKFDPTAKGESFQLICQNKSTAAVNVNVTGAGAPWIVPQGVKNCAKWTKNKLSCDANEGEKNSFFCALASAKIERSSAAPEVTTSVKMRKILLPVAVPVEEIINNIKPEIQLCKALYNVTEKVDMSWSISFGIIKDLSVNSQNADFIACVESVVKQANAMQDVSVKYSF